MESKNVLVLYRPSFDPRLMIMMVQAPKDLNVQELAENSELVAEEFVSWLIREKKCRRIEFERVAI